LTRGDDEAKIEQRVDEILRTGKPSPWDLAEYYVKSFTLPSDHILVVCDLGILPVKIWLHLFKSRDTQTTTEISRILDEDRSNTYRALRNMEEAGFVKRVKRRQWQLLFSAAAFVALQFLRAFQHFVLC
jgi:hypothetical protein